MRSSSEWKATDDQPAAGLQDALGGGERRRQVRQFLVDEDAQRLERPRRRMDSIRPRVNHACRRSRPARAWSRSAPACARRRWRGDRARKRSSPSVAMMLARSRSEARAITSAALGPVAAHAHVERAVETEREAALGLIELHRGHADVEHDAVDRLDGRTGARPRRDWRSGPRPASAARPTRCTRSAPPRDRRSGRGRCR